MRDPERNPLILNNDENDSFTEESSSSPQNYGSMNNHQNSNNHHANSFNDLNQASHVDGGSLPLAHHMTVTTLDETLKLYGYRRNMTKIVGFIYKLKLFNEAFSGFYLDIHSSHFGDTSINISLVSDV